MRGRTDLLDTIKDKSQAALEADQRARALSNLVDTAAPPPELVADAQRRADEHYAALNPTQRAFVNDHTREILFSGPNRQGKSWAGQLLAAWWLTGVYPKEFTGVRLRGGGPVRIVCYGETQDTVRDTFQEPLVGLVETRGPGEAPLVSGIREDGSPSILDPQWISRPTMSRTRGLLGRTWVRHAHGGVSIVLWGSYADRERKIKGRDLDAALIDEGPSLKLYYEILGRLVLNVGPTRVLWCPLIGEAERGVKRDTDGQLKLWRHFESGNGVTRKIAYYPITAATHMSKEARDAQVATWSGTAEEGPRLWGKLAVVGGKTFSNLEAAVVPKDSLPRYAGLRTVIGTDLPHTTGAFAAVKILWDEERDCVWPVAEFQGEAQPRSVYSDAVKAMGGALIPVAWPHDGARASSVKIGDSLRDEYRNDGLRMTARPAAYANLDGSTSNSVRRALADLRERILSGRFKICKELTPQLFEQLDAHRLGKDGKPLGGLNDHEVDALLKALMSLRHSITVDSKLGEVERLHFNYQGGPPTVTRQQVRDAGAGLVRYGWRDRRIGGYRFGRTR